MARNRPWIRRKTIRHRRRPGMAAAPQAAAVAGRGITPMEHLLNFDWRSTLFVLSSLSAIVMIARQLEKRWPAEVNQPSAEVLTDFKLVIANSLLTWLVKPAVAISAVALVN